MHRSIVGGQLGPESVLVRDSYGGPEEVATRRTTVRDGDAGDACLVTASVKSYPVPIVVFSNRWEGSDHPYHPSPSSNPPSSTLCRDSRKGNGIGFEYQSRVFVCEKMRGGEAGGMVDVQGWYTKVC